MFAFDILKLLKYSHVLVNNFKFSTLVLRGLNIIKRGRICLWFLAIRNVKKNVQNHAIRLD